MTVDSIALPIQLDAPIVAVAPDGTEYRIAAAGMVGGELRLDLAPREEPEADDEPDYLHDERGEHDSRL